MFIKIRGSKVEIDYLLGVDTMSINPIIINGKEFFVQKYCNMGPNSLKVRLCDKK